MDLWERLRNLGLTWSGLSATVVALALALFLRRLLPEDRRRRGRATVYFLAAAPFVHFIAHGLGSLGQSLRAPSLVAISAVLELVNLVLLGFGVTGVVGLLVFEIALPKLVRDGRGRVPTIARDVLQASAFLFVVLGTLQASGFNPLSLVAASAVLTAVIGLALQNIMANLLSGLALQIDRTFAIGDWIQVGSRTGKIAQIRWRTTSILTREGDTAIIPNAQLLGNEVLNYSKPSGAHLVTIRITFHHRHAPGDVKRVVLGAIAGVPGLLDAPAPECWPAEFGTGTVTYAVRCWIADLGVEARVEGEVRARVWYASERAELEGPCPAAKSPLAKSAEQDLEAARAEALATRLGALAKVEIFAPIEGAEIEMIAVGMRLARFAAGEPIIVQGREGDSLYLVKSGSVRVEHEVGGARREIAILGPGDVVGEMSLMTGEPRRASCTAITDAACYLVDRPTFQAVLAKNPRMAEEISRVLARREGALEGERASEVREAAPAAATLLSRIRTYFHLA